MSVCRELNSSVLVVFLFATEALETDNCIKQWNKKHKGQLFGALLILIADCVRCVFCSSVFLLLFSWTGEMCCFDSWTTNIKTMQIKKDKFIYRLEILPLRKRWLFGPAGYKQSRVGAPWSYFSWGLESHRLEPISFQLHLWGRYLTCLTGGMPVTGSSQEPFRLRLVMVCETKVVLNHEIHTHIQFIHNTPLSYGGKCTHHLQSNKIIHIATLVQSV